MKKEYISAQLAVVRLQNDIIATSDIEQMNQKTVNLDWEDE